MDECIVSVLKVWTMDNDAVLREVKYKMINDSIREPIVGRIQMRVLGKRNHFSFL